MSIYLAYSDFFVNETVCRSDFFLQFGRQYSEIFLLATRLSVNHDEATTIFAMLASWQSKRRLNPSHMDVKGIAVRNVLARKGSNFSPLKKCRRSCSSTLVAKVIWTEINMPS